MQHAMSEVLENVGHRAEYLYPAPELSGEGRCSEAVFNVDQLSQFPLKAVHVYTPINGQLHDASFLFFEAPAIAEMPLDNASTPAHTFQQGFINHHLACPSGHPNLAGITRKHPRACPGKV
jgi:hypothetical protein